MKAILTLLFALTLGATALANTKETSVVKVEGIQMNVVLTMDTLETPEINIDAEKGTARLYMFKNSRVKKALQFTTKRNRAKLA